MRRRTFTTRREPGPVAKALAYALAGLVLAAVALGGLALLSGLVWLITAAWGAIL